MKMLTARPELMKIPLLLLALLLLRATTTAQSKPAPKASSSATADRLGLTCAKILAMSSTDWVAKYNQEKDASSDGTARAIASYGKCYDARTDAMATGAARKPGGPSKAARSDFAGMETALRQFTAKALDDAEPKPDTTKVAYANLYEKQFRYDFYQAYAEKSLNRALTPEEDEQFGKAKNRFGELLGLLSEDKAHEVHEAFGEVVGTHSMGLAMKLALYRYAILILEPLSEKPFAPPPF